MIPNVLSIAGSDPSGGAGIQADIKSISANGGYAMAAITALTAQNTQGVFGAHLVSPEFVADQIARIFDDINVHAVKIGMLGSVEIVEAVAKALADCTAPIVLDPVMVAKGGDRLLSGNAVYALRDLLVPRAAIITPNLPESADLLGVAEATSQEEMLEHTHALLTLGARAVLLKGGHLSGEKSPDLLRTIVARHWIEAQRIKTSNTHGTGCTLSSALATQIALKHDLFAAVKAAKQYTYCAIQGADSLSVGQGIGPTDHHYLMRARE